jgi:hypothetical protein
MASGITTTELRHSPASLLLSDCAAGPVPIRQYKKQIATLSLYDQSKKHTCIVPLTQLRDLDVFAYRGDTACITRNGKPLLTLEFISS